MWIVYFSLAALPLFGLGQLAIPVYQESRRRYAFCLLAIYVASGLGLVIDDQLPGPPPLSPSAAAAHADGHGRHLDRVGLRADLRRDGACAALAAAEC